MLRNTTVGIDIGTHQIKVVVGELVNVNNKPYTKIIGTGIAESKGLRHGYIVNGADVTASIETAVKMAEKASGIKINKAFIAVGGIGLTSVASTGNTIVSRADLQITEMDIEKASINCEENIPNNLIQNQKILHSIPLSYKIDGKPILSKSPLDMKGTKLEVKMLFVTCLEPHLNDLLEAVDETGIDVIDVMASPIAASFATLSKLQKTAGCVLVNIGSETMSIVVFENNIPVSLEVFPIGSTDITNDIALGLKIPLEEAENIKIGSIGSGSYPKKKLEEIISARLTDMFELVENHLKKIGRNGLLPAGVFITGGGSGIGMIEDFAKGALKLPSRIAELNLNDQKTNVKDSTWSVAYGLCMLGLSKEEKTNLGLRYSGYKIWNKVYDKFQG
ncbi:MAG: Cell division protein ftsA [Parcubacteria group bacterium Gr01-1014_46]|nr:MAG: Cell division protein ftsA [Parcubacteria group bacterium Gr01-1014_46]